MSMTVFIIAVFLLAVIIWLVFDLRKKVAEGDGKEDGEKLTAVMERLTYLTEQNRDLRRAMDSKLSETHRASQEQISNTIKTVQDVVAGLTKLEETNKQVINFSAQLQNLQDILKNPKQRGVLGEYFLEETLKNVLPPNSYQMQYLLKDGSVVDAVVFVQKKVIPVDSKFSLENYEKILNSKDSEEREKWENQLRKDLKTRIDETSKYIKPTENTMDFA